MYEGFADEVEKISADVSAKQIYAQRKADEDFKDLMSSKDKGAIPKAFVAGFTVGGALPFALQTIPWMADYKSVMRQNEPILRQAYLANLLTSKKVLVNEEAARVAAVGLDRYFHAPGTPADNVSIALQHLRYRMADDALAAHKAGKKPAVTPWLDEAYRELSANMKNMPRALADLDVAVAHGGTGFASMQQEREALMQLGAIPPTLNRKTGVLSGLGQVGDAETRHIYNVAQAEYKKDLGRKALTENKLYLKALRKHMGRALKGSLPFAALGGITAALAMRAKKGRALGLDSAVKQRGRR